MAIGQVDLNHAMTRIQDFTTQRHNEENKGLVDQNHFQGQFHKEINTHMKQVVKPEQTEYQIKKFDAKHKGNGQYSGDGGKKRKKGQTSDGHVLPKADTGFDVKI